MAKKGNKPVDLLTHAAAAMGTSQTPEGAIVLPESIDGVQMVPAHLIESTADAWKQAHDAYYRKGGIADLKKELEAHKTADTSVGNLLLKVGKACLMHTGGETKKALAFFKGACQVVETTARQDSKDEEGKMSTVQKLLPTWAPAKSIVSKALEHGFALLDEDSNKNQLYPGISAVAQAVRNARGARTSSGGGGATQSPAEAVTSMFKSAPLRVAFEGLMKQLVSLDETAQTQAAEILVQTVGVVANLRATPAEQKEINQAVAHATERVKATQRSRKEAQMRGGSRAAA